MRASLAILLFAVVLSGTSPVTAQDPTPAATPASTPPSWFSRISPAEPGTFPPPRPYRANYRIAWSSLEAARLAAAVSTPADAATIRTEVQANSTGAARTLYKMDATYVGTVDRTTLRPQSVEQTESGSKKHTTTNVAFTPDGATRTERDLNRKDGTKGARKTKSFAYPGMLDMSSVLLQLRSLPLADGDERTYLFMTAGNPYLATVKVVGRGTVHVRAGDFPAIQCSLKLEKVGKNGTLEPRKGFKSGNAWLSDDANRLLIKAQTDIFIGAVYLELESVQFPK